MVISSSVVVNKKTVSSCISIGVVLYYFAADPIEEHIVYQKKRTVLFKTNNGDSQHQAAASVGRGMFDAGSAALRRRLRIKTNPRQPGGVRGHLKSERWNRKFFKSRGDELIDFGNPGRW